MTDLPALREAVATIANYIPYAANDEHHDDIIKRMVAVDLAKRQLLDAAPALLDEVERAREQNAVLVADASDSNVDANEARADLAAAQDERDTLLAHANDLERDSAALRAENVALTDMVRGQEDELLRRKALIEAAQHAQDHATERVLKAEHDLAAVPLCGEHQQYAKSHDGECFGCDLAAARAALDSACPLLTLMSTEDHAVLSVDRAAWLAWQERQR